MYPDPLTHADERLRAAVLEALAAEPVTAPCELRVGVLNGVIHLAGSAQSLAAWERAGAVAAGLPGVRGVVNRIDAPGAPSPSRTIHLKLG